MYILPVYNVNSFISPITNGTKVIDSINVSQAAEIFQYSTTEQMNQLTVEISHQLHLTFLIHTVIQTLSQKYVFLLVLINQKFAF